MTTPSVTVFRDVRPYGADRAVDLVAVDGRTDQPAPTSVAGR
ncbi:hypothetical protein ACWGKU_13060 [Kitasatospora sp. NPDC054768]